MSLHMMQYTTHYMCSKADQWQALSAARGPSA